MRFDGGLTVHFVGLWFKLSWQCFEICWGLLVKLIYCVDGMKQGLVLEPLLFL